jgi:hypothetical protein
VCVADGGGYAPGPAAPGHVNGELLSGGLPPPGGPPSPLPTPSPPATTATATACTAVDTTKQQHNG